MAFSFGNTGQSAFGSQPAKPVFGGSTFGTPAATSTSTPNFGFGSTFGQPQQPTFGQQTSTFGATQSTPAFGTAQQTPAFGATQSTPAFGSTFGQPAAASAAPTFGSTFGAQASTAAPTFGSTFGTPAASAAAPTFGTGTGSTFGAGSGTGLFGSTTTTKPSLFGTQASTSTGPSLFPTPATTSSLFGVGGGGGVGGTTSNTNLFGGGATAGGGLFGTSTAATTTTTPNLFGPAFGGSTSIGGTGGGLFGTTSTTATPSTGFSLFGSTTTTTPSLFGTGTSTTSLAGTGTGGGFNFGSGTTFGGFGAGTAGTTGGGGGLFGTSSLFGAKPQQFQQQQQQQIIDPQQKNQLVLASIYSVNIFNDERDDILKKWNMLQACWGVGQGYYNPHQPPVEYTKYNPFYRFKAVCYNSLPRNDNAEGIVKLTFSKKFNELNSQKQQIIDGLTNILGNKPSLKVTVEDILPQGDNETDLRITVTEKGITGVSRKIPAKDLAQFLNQPSQKQQLTNVGVIHIIPIVKFSNAEIDEFLNNIPQGLDPQMWKAAIDDNPDPTKFIPVAVYGFEELKCRKVQQDYAVTLHQAFINDITKQLSELKEKHSNSIARINEFRHRFIQLQHRTLKILVKQESIRKAGLALTPEEEYLKGKLETIYSQLNVPTHFKGKLNELISTVKVMDTSQQTNQNQYKINPEGQAELKEFLQLQQQGISKLVDIIKEDMKNLSIIMEGSKKALENQNILMS